MNTYILYIATLIIFISVIFIAARAIYKNRHENKVLDKVENIEETSNITSDLQKLGELYKNGIISEEEFARAKEKVLKNQS